MPNSRPSNRIPDETREQIVADLLAGMTQRVVAARHRVSVAFIERLKLERNLPKLSVEDRVRRAIAARQPRQALSKTSNRFAIPEDVRRRDLAALKSKSEQPPTRVRKRSPRAFGRYTPRIGEDDRIVPVDDRVEITTMWLDGAVPSYIAFALGLDIRQVKPFIQKLKARGGWYTLVYARECLKCGRWFVATRSHARFHIRCSSALTTEQRRTLIAEAGQ